MILIYLFCAIRLAIPFEVPWAHVVSGGAVYNSIHSALNFEVGSVRIYELFFSIWFVGMVVSLSRYFAQYRRAMRCFQDMPLVKSRRGAGASGRDGGEGTCKGVEIPGIKTPCCMGRLTLPKRRIFYRRRRKMGHMGNM